MTAQQYTFVAFQLLLDQGKKLNDITDKDTQKKLDEEWEKKLAEARAKQNKEESIEEIQKGLIEKIDKEKQNGRRTA